MGESPEWGGEHDFFSDPEEQKHLYSVLDSFRQYRRAAHLNTTHTRRQNLYALPTAQWRRLSAPPFNLLTTLSLVDAAIDTNADLADAILASGLASVGLADPEAADATTGAGASEGGPASTPWRGAASKSDVDKARSTLNQLYRDWSKEGAVERAACYDPVLRDLAELFPEDVVDGGEGVRVLVPGAGLGRLVFELCRAGFHVEGNEISYHQLLTSSFILNHTTRPDEWPLHPFALSFSNNLTRADQLRRVMVPDVWPRGVEAAGSMSMTTGDFCVLYRGAEYEGVFDAVVTVFFIDTAPNLMRYVEAVRNCLKPGGVWVNLGPLLWHFWDGRPNNEEAAGSTKVKTGGVAGKALGEESLGIGEPGAFELSEDEVMALLVEYGFTIEKHETEGEAAGYVQNTRSMLRSVYHPSHWVARLQEKEEK